MPKPSTFSGQVLSLAFGGSGILRQNDLVIFCPFTLPGELIEGVITQHKKNYAIGELTKVFKPSQKRVSPRCPHFGTCGGCQLQHLAYQAQLDVKHQWVEEALHRIGKFPEVYVEPTKASTNEWTYRRHISLTLKPSQNGYEAGYIGFDNKSLLQPAACPIFIKEDIPIFNLVKELSQHLKPKDHLPGKLVILKERSDAFILEFHFKNLPSNSEEVLGRAIEKYPSISGLICRSLKKTLQWGNPYCKAHMDHLAITYSSSAFIQNHPDTSEIIYRDLIEIAKKCPHDMILDLYCGIGISSLMLSRIGKKIIGVELSKEAVKLARQNCLDNRISNVEFIQGDVEKVLMTLPKIQNLGLTILNPPRIGLTPKVIEGVLARKPQEIIYISCMPPTLARDLKLFCDKGYKINLIQPYDMFPQTTHVETLVHLKAK